MTGLALRTLSALCCTVALSSSAVAADNGEMRGLVLDQESLGMPGAEITVSGGALAHERYTTTDDLGRFRVRDIPPGEYRVLIAHPSAEPVDVGVVIRAHRTTDVPVTLSVGGSDGAIVIVDQLPVLDMTTSSVSTVLDGDTLQDLPVTRDFLSVAETLPGVTAQFGTTASARGEGALGNSFRIDGIITRDPGDHSLAQTMNFDAIQELQVYTDGAPAEFGPFSGMLLNIVTKSGGDRHTGSVAGFYNQHAVIVGDQQDPNARRQFWEPSLAFTAGGPAVPKRLFYFTAFDLNYRGVRPEGLETLEQTASLQGMGKLTWAVNERVLLRYSSNVAPARTDHVFDGEPVTDDARSDRVGLSQSHLLDLEFGLSGDRLIEARFGYTNRAIRTSPGSDELLTAALTNSDGLLYGNARSEMRQRSGRLGGSFVFTQYADNLAGSHRVRAGADAWLLSFSTDTTHSGQTERAWIDETGATTDLRTVGTEFGPSPGLPCERIDGSDCGVRLSRHSPGRLRNRVSTWSIFAQDDWAPTPDVHLNLGLRIDVEDGRNNVAAIPRGLDLRVMPAHRLGAAYDVLGRGSTKLFANVGRYYDVGGAPFWAPSNTRSPQSVIIERRDQTGEWQWAETLDPVSERRYDIGIERTDRFVVGASQKFGESVVTSVRGIRSATRQIPQDTLADDGSVLVLSDTYKRDYNALELAVQRVHRDNWVAYASYTIATSRGHVDNALLRLPLGVQAPYGPLNSDVRHQIRANGSWTSDFGLNLGLIYAFNSGRAYSRRTLVEPYGFVGFADGRGTERTQAMHRIDLRMAYTVDIGRNSRAEFTADVFNLVGSQVPLVVNESDTESFGTPLVRQEPRSVRLGARLRW